MKIKLLQTKNQFKSKRKNMLLASAFMLAGISAVSAQDIHFEFNGEGESKAMTHWGVDTAWPSPDNVRQSIFHMGLEQVDVVRINFFMFEPLDENGEIGPESKAFIDNQLSLAALAGAVPIALTPATGEYRDYDGDGQVDGPTHPYYLDENGNAIPERWLALMEATQKYIGQPIHALEIFNEPDYWVGMGTPQTLREIMLLTAQSPVFAETELHAASTLCSCSAQYWYDAVADVATHGTLHQLASWGGNGSEFYINFIEHVKANGDIPYNDELHSMAEVLYGAEYGMQGGIWWADALLTRGKLVNAVQGKRLGYGELRWKDATGAVYRAPDGEVYGFAGSFEREGPNHSFRYISDDQAVYFEGIGPIKEFMMPTWADPHGGYINIDEEPVVPALDGYTWKIVNKAGNRVIEAEGLDNGANLRTAKDSDSSSQKWKISRSRDGYLSFINVGTGKSADVYEWSTSDGGNIAQWDNFNSLNQKWWLEPAEEGYFYIRSGHSNLYLEDVKTHSKNVIQGEFNDSDRQQWKFQLVEDSQNGELVAHYQFEGDASDSSAALNHGSGSGSISYDDSNPAENQGQYLELSGGWDWWGEHIQLPSDIANSEDITIASWINWQGGAALQRVFDFGIDTNRYMFLTPADADGKMRFSMTTQSWWDEQSMVTQALPTNEWVHIAITLGGNTAKIYINGQLQVAGYMFINPSDIYADAQNQQNFIGRSQWGDPTFIGSIDDFRIYNYALNADAIAELAEVN